MMCMTDWIEIKTFHITLWEFWTIDWSSDKAECDQSIVWNFWLAILIFPPPKHTFLMDRYSGVWFMWSWRIEQNPSDGHVSHPWDRITQILFIDWGVKWWTRAQDSRSYWCNRSHSWCSSVRSHEETFHSNPTHEHEISITSWSCSQNSSPDHAWSQLDKDCNHSCNRWTLDSCCQTVGSKDFKHEHLFHIRRQFSWWCLQLWIQQTCFQPELRGDAKEGFRVNRLQNHIERHANLCDRIRSLCICILKNHNAWMEAE